MAPLTRAAQRRLDAAAAVQREETQAQAQAPPPPPPPPDVPKETVAFDLSLRESVSTKREAVWEYREGRDIYTQNSRKDTMRPQVDHVVEVQLAEVAMARHLSRDAIHNKTEANNITVHQQKAIQYIKDNLNDIHNLNVTTARINQAKRGPITAALRRLESDRLRTVTVEQMARQGRAKDLVDNGVWAKIEGAIVKAYDEVSTHASGEMAGPPGAHNTVEAVVEELGAVLSAIGVE